PGRPPGPARRAVAAGRPRRARHRRALRVRGAGGGRWWAVDLRQGLGVPQQPRPHGRGVRPVRAGPLPGLAGPGALLQGRRAPVAGAARRGEAPGGRGLRPQGVPPTRPRHRRRRAGDPAGGRARRAVSTSPGVPVRHTRRLVLRAFGEPDREPFAALNADPEVVRHLQGPSGRERSDAFVDRIAACWSERGYGLWALELRSTGEFLGYTGL